MNPGSIFSLEDIGEALGVSMDRGGLVLGEADLSPAFFDLRSGFAGEVLQKFTNYRARLAIVVIDASSHGSRFSELVYEHRTHACVRFFSTAQLARQWLAYNPVVKC